MDYDVRKSYQGIENAENFKTSEELERYRESCLIKTQTELEFFSTILTGTEKVFEIGSGNGRLLITLKKNKLISQGTGIDVSHSRTAFAKKWTADLKLQELEFLSNDILDTELKEKFNLFICITGAFGYFDGLKKKGAAKVLEKISSAAEPGAKLIIELYLYPEEIKKGRLREWKELSSDDPFRFYLYEKKWDGHNKLLYNQKIFIGCDGTVDEGRNDCQRIYTLGEITVLLSEHGFETEKVYRNWQREEYRTGDEAMIIQAIKI